MTPRNQFAAFCYFRADGKSKTIEEGPVICKYIGVDVTQILLNWPGAMTVSEAARLLRTSPATLRRWLGEGTFPGYRLQGSWRLNPLDIVDYLHTHRNFK
jgi:excisionase family DNA binding protein